MGSIPFVGSDVSSEASGSLFSLEPRRSSKAVVTLSAGARGVATGCLSLLGYLPIAAKRIFGWLHFQFKSKWSTAVLLGLKAL